MNQDQQRFDKLLSFNKRIKTRYLHVLAAQKIFNEFNKLSTESIVGKAGAKNNVNIFNKYKYFILISKESLRCFFLIELAKFFDEDKREQNLSIRKILNFAHAKVESFSVDQFQIHHKDRKIIPELFANFKALTKKDLDKIDKRLKDNKEKIKKIKDYRDQYLAHDDIKKDNILIEKRDANTLMEIIEDTIELLFHKLDFSSTSYDNYKKEPVKDINRLIKDLKNHEKLRILTFERKYGVKIKI
ncbi:MAG: hypothetical protein WC662_00640 [Candidatus Paceibacterota bacterium]|jgi:hypothetical protein